MEFERIKSFKKMTQSELKTVFGGGDTTNTTYKDTKTTCGTGSKPNSDNCTLKDIDRVTRDNT